MAKTKSKSSASKSKSSGKKTAGLVRPDLARKKPKKSKSA